MVRGTGLCASFWIQRWKWLSQKTISSASIHGHPALSCAWKYSQNSRPGVFFFNFCSCCKGKMCTKEEERRSLCWTSSNPRKECKRDFFFPFPLLSVSQRYPWQYFVTLLEQGRLSQNFLVFQKCYGSYSSILFITLAFEAKRPGCSKEKEGQELHAYNSD